MTRDDLIDIVARRINGVENKYMSPTVQHKRYAEVAIDAVFAALKEPTEQMQWDGDDNMHIGSPTKIWQAMLAASPLAPEGGRE